MGLLVWHGAYTSQIKLFTKRCSKLIERKHGKAHHVIATSHISKYFYRKQCNFTICYGQKSNKILSPYTTGSPPHQGFGVATQRVAQQHRQARIAKPQRLPTFHGVWGELSFPPIPSSKNLDWLWWFNRLNLYWFMIGLSWFMTPIK